MAITASASMTEISPYYEPGAPPPTLPILVAQTEIGNTQSPSKLLAQEEIGSGPILKRQTSGIRFAPYPKLVLRRHATPSELPLPSTARPPTRANSAAPAIASSQAALPDPESSTGSSSDSDSESLSDAESDDDHLVPKPPGEAGRPGCGGYNLEETLSWQAKEYRRVKRFVKKLVKEHLDISKSFNKQHVITI